MSCFADPQRLFSQLLMPVCKRREQDGFGRDRVADNDLPNPQTWVFERR